MTARSRFIRHACRLGLAGTLIAAGCSDDGNTDRPTQVTAAPAASGATDDVGQDDRYPDVLDAVATYDDTSMTWTFSVTLSSPYDSPERYADGWRVMDTDGTVYGVHTLGHDHANEQPFTRRQSNVVIPDEVDEVIIEGRDQKYGFGGATVALALHTG